MKPPQPVACPWKPEELDRFVSGECDRDEARVIEGHVATCAACSGFVEDRLKVRRALRSAMSADAGPPPELLEAMRDRLRDSAARPTRQPIWRPLAMAAGIVLAATGALAVAWMASGSGPGSGALNVAALRLASDAEHHGKCVEEMAGRVPPAPGSASHRDAEVSRLEAIVREQAIGGMTIADAHRCTDGQRRYVHIVIEREGALAGVLVSDLGDQQAGGADGLPVVATAKTATYTIGGKVVSVISNSPAIDASVLADRLKPSLVERPLARMFAKMCVAAL